jgi:alginate O-acetyltransferase complex protein AlgI
MLFTSPVFLFGFLPFFLALYYLGAPSVVAKNFVALAGSILFFSWGEPVFVFILIAFTFIDYRVSLSIAPSSKLSKKNKIQLLLAAISLDVAVLIVSKYLDFIVNQIAAPFDAFLHIKLQAPNLPLLLGISFITFHRVSYLVDSYKGRATPPRNFFDCALYIFLFPQLIAGPIIRYHDIGSQIHHREHTAEGFLTGFLRFGIGLAKKLIIADPLGLVADKIFALPSGSASAVFAWGGIIAYTLQIYFDFSAYSDMAIGLGKMMGFRFPENFNRPYISRSVTEFWRRWHISLSNWMRIYLYIPLGGNRTSSSRTYFNLWVVFLISGIWHGASWNFITWGAYYGIFLCLEKAFSTSLILRVSIPDVVKQAMTLLIVMIGWVFFRAEDLSYAITYLGSMFGFHPGAEASLPPWGLVFGNRALATMAIATLIACVTIPKRLQLFPTSLRAAWSDTMTVHGNRAMSIQFGVTLLLILLSASAIVSSDYVPFLYFRF